MGGHRSRNNQRNNNHKSGQQQHSEPSSSPHFNNSSNGTTILINNGNGIPPAEQHQKTKTNLDFNTVLQEVEGGFQVTWKEVIFTVVGVAILILLSIFVGVAAGMTISIHYYETQTPAIRRMDPLLYGGGSNSYGRRVTTLDPNIAMFNILRKPGREPKHAGLELGKVITTSESGQLHILMVVEESEPLPNDDDENDGGSINNMHSEHQNIGRSGDDLLGPPLEGGASASEGSGGGQHHDPHTRRQSTTAGAKTLSMELANILVPNYDKWKANQPNFALPQPTILPTLCDDGETVGFNDWRTLKSAVQEANAISARRFVQWSAYFAKVGKSFSAFEDDLLYYEQDIEFTVCPRKTLKARQGPIFINAENVVIQCDGCVIHVGGTHLTFGPHARNVLVRGITFKGAQSSSLTFFHDGAEASFEDCLWIENKSTNARFGSIADMNSSSTVNFYQCEIGEIRRNAVGSTSSVSIRS